MRSPRLFFWQPDEHMHSTSASPAATLSAASLKWLWAAVGVLGVSVLALGGTLLAQNLRGGSPAGDSAAGGPAATLAATAPRTPEAEMLNEKAPPAQSQQAMAALDSGANPTARRAAAPPSPQAYPQDDPQTYAQGYPQPGASPSPVPTQRGEPLQRAVAQRSAAPVCATCGRVESVRAVEQAAPATGVGAVAGGVLGGVLGNQIGKGSGRAAATVLGAVGGGYVGHKVEQRARTTTVYQMRVRMDDGSVRNFTRAQPLAEGTAVRVQGKSLRVDTGADADRAGVEPVRVVDRGY